jgi:hypothetical protein
MSKYRKGRQGSAMAKKTGMRLDLYMREGDTIIVAEPYQTRYVLKFQWDGEASAVNLYLSVDQAHEVLRRLGDAFAVGTAPSV